MGYQTDFIGYLQVLPELNESERTLIDRISGSIFADRHVTGLKRVEEREAAQLELLERGPRGWSNWTACPTGCCLSYDGGDKANHMIPWLKFLMSTFLVPSAEVQSRAGFEAFTCDHVINGMVVGSRRDNRELYAITVRDNEVEVEMLWPGVKDWSTYPPLAYQERIDEFRDWVVEQPNVDLPDDLRGWRGW